MTERSHTRGLGRLLTALALIAAIAVPVTALAATGSGGSGAAGTADGTSGLLTTWEKPSKADLTEPFPENGLGSTYFRIPSIVRVSDNVLVASADARWGTTLDSPGNIDDVVSVSTDGGATWNLQTVDRFLDVKDATNDWGGITWPGRPSTNGVKDMNASYIDPSMLVASDGSLYRVVDVMPANVGNVTRNGSSTSFGTMGTASTGFDAEGHLLLSKGSAGAVASTDANQYTYYVATDGTVTAKVDGADRRLSPIRAKADDADQGFYVDAEFNLYQATTADGATTYTPVEVDQYDNGTGTTTSGAKVQANIFYAQSEWKVYPTSYLGMRKGRVQGNTVVWEDMRLLSNVKVNGEGFLGTGAGLGIAITKKAGGERLLFPVYHVVNGALRTSVIYSDDGGQTWNRSADIQGQQTSESQIVQLSDGNLRLYSRSRTSQIQVATSTTDGTSWGNAAPDAQLPGVTDNNVSFINIEGSVTDQDGNTYGNLVMGSYGFSSRQQGTNTAGRWGGILRLGSMAADGTVTWLTPAAFVNPSYPLNEQYSYSSLVQIDGEKIGHLWETQNDANRVYAGRIRYDEVKLTELLQKATGKTWTYTPGSFTVTFDADNGTAATTQRVKNGGKATQPAQPTKTGYTFAGWFKDGSATAWSFDTDTVGEALTLKARWTANTYTLTFDGNADAVDPAQGVPGAITGTYGDALKEPTAPTRPGYTFTGWYTVKDPAQQGAASKFDWGKPVEGAKTLYAGWKIRSFTMSFDAAGGTETYAPQSVVYRELASDPGTPTRSGYIFAGWFNGTTRWVFGEYGMPAEDVRLTAHWTAEKHTVTVSLNYPGAPAAETLTVNHDGTLARPRDPQRAGYTFGGWYADKELTQVFDFAAPVSGDVTLYAKWTKAGTGTTGTTPGTAPGSTPEGGSGTTAAGAQAVGTAGSKDSKKTGTAGTLPKSGDDAAPVLLGALAGAGSALIGIAALLRRRPAVR